MASRKALSFGWGLFFWACPARCRRCPAWNRNNPEKICNAPVETCPDHSRLCKKAASAQTERFGPSHDRRSGHPEHASKKGGKEVFYFNLFRSVLNAPGADQSRIYRNLAIGPAIVACASLMLMLTQPQPSEQRYTMNATVASIHHERHESGNLVTIEFHATHGPKARMPLEFTTAPFRPRLAPARRPDTVALPGNTLRHRASIGSAARAGATA